MSAPSLAAPGPPTLASRARRALRDEGVLSLLRRSAKRIASPALGAGSLRFFAREVAAEEAPAVERTDVVFREAHAGEVAALLAGSDPQRSAAALAERFRRGDRCFVVADLAGGILHSRWLASADPYLPELQRRMRLAPGIAYFYDGYTRPEARGRGLDAVARRGIFRVLRREGSVAALSYVRGDNPVGIRAAARAQSECGRVRYLRLGNRVVLVGGAATLAGRASFEAPDRDDEEERSARAGSWRRWFESWLAEAPERRSTGFDALPAEYFVAMSGFVADTLELSAETDSVLDVGCDSAMVSRGVAPRCLRLTGVDLVPGLIWNAPPLAGGGKDPRERRPDGMAAADARRLPFPDGAFDKVYCLSMIHTLPSQDDAWRVLGELLRVCAPGGRLLLAALPDRGRRWRARREVWARGDLRERAKIVAALVVPDRLKPWVRKVSGDSGPRLVTLDFDFAELARRVAPHAADWRVVPFDDGFWSRDFRATRSNLLITMRGEGAAAPRPAAATAS